MAVGPAELDGTLRPDSRRAERLPQHPDAGPGRARLRILEARTENLQREMAWDDPLVMAALIASGEALAGRVVAVDPERRTLNATAGHASAADHRRTRASSSPDQPGRRSSSRLTPSVTARSSCPRKPAA